MLHGSRTLLQAEGPVKAPVSPVVTPDARADGGSLHLASGLVRLARRRGPHGRRRRLTDHGPGAAVHVPAPEPASIAHVAFTAAHGAHGGPSLSSGGHCDVVAR